MAKKKTAKKKSSGRRRRVGSVNVGAGLKDIAMNIVGFAGAQMLTNAVESATKKTLDPKIKGAALLAAGLMGPKLLKMTSPTAKAVANGIAIRGGVILAGSFGIKGLGSAPVYVPMRVAGSGVKQMVAGGQGISQTVGSAKNVALYHS